MLIEAKTALTCSVLSLTGMAMIDPLAGGQKLGMLGPAAILGVVCIACVWAIVRLYNDRAKEAKEHIDALYKLIESNISVNTRTADHVATSTQLMVEVKGALKACETTQAALKVK